MLHLPKLPGWSVQVKHGISCFDILALMISWWSASVLVEYRPGALESDSKFCCLPDAQRLKEKFSDLTPVPNQASPTAVSQGVAPSFSSFMRDCCCKLWFNRFLLLFWYLLISADRASTAYHTLKVLCFWFLFWYSCIKFPHLLVFVCIILFLQPWYSGWIVKKNIRIKIVSFGRLFW